MGGKSSVEKTFYYLSNVSREEHTIQCGKDEYPLYAKEGVIIRTSMFHADHCIRCGRCCGDFDTVFFGNEIRAFSQNTIIPNEIAEYPGINQDDSNLSARQLFMSIKQTVPVFVDYQERGEIIFTPPTTAKTANYICPRKPNKRNCRYMGIDGEGNNLCTIHTFRPISCGFPHMELYGTEKNKYGFLGHKQYGRNSFLGCPINVKDEPYDESTKQSNIYWLKRLLDVSVYLEIETFLPEIISILENVDINNPPTKDIIIQ